MAKYKTLVVEEETGRIIKEESICDTQNSVLRKIIIDNMLNEATKIEDIDKDMLYAWCRITNEVNDRGQVKILGDHMELIKDDKLKEDITIAGYTVRIIGLAHPFSGLLKKNRQTFITTWTELWEEIGCTGRKTQITLKKFLTQNSIIREFNAGKGKRFILNPFLARGASYSSQVAISVFEDYIKEGINMNTYPIRLLQSWGLIA